MERIIYITFLITLIISCSQENIPPKSLLSKEQLIEVLYDFHFVDAASKQSIIANNRNNKIKHAQYKGVLEHHKISKEQFDSTLNYYISIPEELKVIYEKVEQKFIP